jgi:hypothetical protein
MGTKLREAFALFAERYHLFTVFRLIFGRATRRHYRTTMLTAALGVLEPTS